MDKRNKWHRLIIRNMPLFRGAPPALRLRVWMRLAINPEFGFAYVRIPKAANSTVARTLALYAYPEARAAIEADPRGSEAKKLFQSLSPQQCLTRHCLRQRFFTFSFFRHPYSRVLSAYLDKVRSDYSRQKKGWERKNAAWSLEPTASFDEFVNSLERGNLYANVHWAPQTTICPLPVRQLDFVGRVENLEADLAEVAARLFGVEENEPSGQREHNRQNAAEKIEAYYSPELMERVYRLYQDDFEQIGYDFEVIKPASGETT